MYYTIIKLNSRKTKPNKMCTKYNNHFGLTAVFMVHYTLYYYINYIVVALCMLGTLYNSYIIYI